MKLAYRRGSLLARSPTALTSYEFQRVRLTPDIADAPSSSLQGYSIARISRKRCTARTRYTLHSRARSRSRLCRFLVNLSLSLSRSPFIEIYSPKHSRAVGTRDIIRVSKRNSRQSFAVMDSCLCRGCELDVLSFHKASYRQPQQQ